MSTVLRACPKPASRPKKARLPVRKRNPERAAKRYARDYGEKGEWIRLQRCAVTGAMTGQYVFDPFEQQQVRVQVVASHFPSRGAGGRAEHLIPLAWHLEMRSHREKKRLEAEYGVDLKALAVEYEKRWQRDQARRAP